jgi:hypothetical protein
MSKHLPTNKPITSLIFVRDENDNVIGIRQATAEESTHSTASYLKTAKRINDRIDSES